MKVNLLISGVASCASRRMTILTSFAQKHLTTKGNGFYTLHKSVDKRAKAFTGSILPRTLPLRISGLTATIHDTNTGTKKHPSRITPSRPRSSPMLSSIRDISIPLNPHKLTLQAQSLVNKTTTSSQPVTTTIVPLALLCSFTCTNNTRIFHENSRGSFA